MSLLLLLRPSDITSDVGGTATHAFTARGTASHAFTGRGTATQAFTERGTATNVFTVPDD